VKLACFFSMGMAARRLHQDVRRLGSSCLAVVVLIVWTATNVMAQTQTVERAFKGASAKDIRIGLYLNVKADCSSGPLPSIRLLTPPANGTVKIKRGDVSATNYKQCLALEVPGFVAFYRSKPDFSGVDVVTLEAKYPNGRTEVQRITVTVGGEGNAGREI
jgi:hypothetical protein